LYGDGFNFPFIRASVPAAICFDIGNGRLGVLATDQQDAEYPATRMVRLVVIDAASGAVVEVRGDIAGSRASENAYASGSCAIREGALVAGVPSTPAVLFVNVGEYTYDVVPTAKKEQYVSTDGGWTWSLYAQNANGTPYYLGNRSHPAVITHLP
jgi:hypothetical protein